MKSKSKSTVFFLVFFALICFQGLNLECFAQLTYQTSWIGNTYSGTDNKWVQNFVEDMAVGADGTVATNSSWDENGRCNGIYKDGDVVGKLLGPQRGVGGCWCWGTAGKSVAIDDGFIYLNNCEGDVVTYSRNNNHNFVAEHKIGFVATGMTIQGDHLFLAGNNTVQIRNKTTMALVKEFSVPSVEKLAVDLQQRIWVIAGNKILSFNQDGFAQAATIDSIEDPSAIGVDNLGRLMVADDGWRRQILFYDVTNSPVFVNAFGQEGGISAGTPGLVEPDKLFHITGVGTDNDGNLYVTLSLRESIIRKFRPAGDMVWEVQALNFLDNVDADAVTDGDLVYGSDEIYEMDYSKPAGQQWKLKAITLDKIKYPNDPRQGNHSTTSAFVRDVDGQKLLFLAGQVSEGFYVYYFNPETDGMIAIYAGFLKGNEGWAKWVDKYGNVWSAGNSEKLIYKHPLTGFKATGEPIYGSRLSYVFPTEFISIMKIVYDADQDLMYLGGFTTDNPDPGGAWGLVGTEILRFEQFTTNPTLAWRVELPFSTWEGGSAPDMILPKSLVAAGDYLFVAYVWNDGVTAVKPPVHVYSAQTGEKVGIMSPGSEVGTTGWIDISFGVNVYQRLNGEYLVFLEDGSRAKNIMYQWCPSGDCSDSDMQVSITSPQADEYVLTTDSVHIMVDATSAASSIKKLNFFVNDQLVGSDESAPWKFSWKTNQLGKYALKAVAENIDGTTRRSTNVIPIIIGDGLPQVQLLSPDPLAYYSVVDTILFKVSAIDNGTINTLLYYLDNELWAEFLSMPFDTAWTNPTPGQHTIFAVAIDNDNNVVHSDTITITVYDFTEPANLEHSENGLRYHYFEGSFDTLPDFTSLAPINLGRVNNFSIAPRDRNDDFAFWFSGYIDVPEDGVYDFFTISDDGSKLYIGDKEIVDNDGLHGNQERNGSALLRAGKHPITVTFFERGGGEVLEVYYQGPGISKMRIPDQVLYRQSFPGNTPPEIEISFPTDQALLIENKTVTITAEANDADNNLEKIEFFVGNTLLGRKFAEPFSLEWTVTGTGEISLTAKATDQAGAINISDPVNIRINNYPTVAISAPANNAKLPINSEISITVNATDDDSVEKVTFYVNDTEVYQANNEPFEFVYEALTVGTFKLTAKATDNTSLQTVSKPVNIIIEDDTSVSDGQGLHDLSVYPNPTSGLLHISLSDYSQPARLEVLDVFGHMVIEGFMDGKDKTIGVNQLPNGLYILRISDGLMYRSVFLKQ